MESNWGAGSERSQSSDREGGCAAAGLGIDIHQLRHAHELSQLWCVHRSRSPPPRPREHRHHSAVCPARRQGRRRRGARRPPPPRPSGPLALLAIHRVPVRHPTGTILLGHLIIAALDVERSWFRGIHSADLPTVHRADGEVTRLMLRSRMRAGLLITCARWCRVAPQRGPVASWPWRSCWHCMSSAPRPRSP